jgi:chorismate mutase
MSQRLFASRGAIDVSENDSRAILEATATLMRELVERNSLTPENVVSIVFTVTDDLDAEFPAVAARDLGFGRVALLCAREIPVPGSMPMVIRVLIHYHAPEDHRPVVVYLGKTASLREDL